MSSFVLLDTNIWHFTFVRPSEEEYTEIHDKAKEFFFNILIDDEIRVGMSAYQVGEILEVLRRSGVSLKNLSVLVSDFEKTKFYFKELDFEIVKRSFSDSSESNIHIYDYLVAYPLRGIVSQIYSADDHFQHRHFKEMAEVINPLHPWILREGIKPQKT